MKEYRRLLYFLQGELKYLLVGAVCMMFSALFDGITLGMIVPVTDKIFTDKKIILPDGMPEFAVGLVDKVNSLEPTFLFKLLIIFLPCLFLLKGIFKFLQGFVMNILSQRVMMNVRNKLYEKLQFLSLDFYSRRRQGELMARITNDVNMTGHAISYGLTDLIYQSLQVVIFCCIVTMINLKLFLISAFVFPVIGLLVYKIGKKVKKFSTTSQERMADLNTSLAETIQGIRIIKAFQTENYESKKFKNINWNYFRYMIKITKRTLLMPPVTEFIGVLGAVLIVYLGGHQVMRGELSFGVFGLFLGALLSMIRPCKKLSKVHAINQKALAASRRIYSILDISFSIRERKEDLDLREEVKEIEYKNVWFKYAGTNDFVLKDISFKANKGDVVAVVGPTGVGKSTLLNFLVRFYNPTKGEILFNNINIDKIRVSSIRKKVGLVTQDMILFNDTLRNNIAYGKLDASDEEIESAARKALAYDFIKHLPEKFNTVVGERGFILSGGEKQRVCIARAILKNPEILILDEATSQLDSESENLVQGALNNLMQGRTVFVIAHRLSTIKHASKILVMQSGRIVESGTHKALLENSDMYKKLYQLQFNF